MDPDRSTTASGGVRPDALTRGFLLMAAALPWYAVASGIFGLYFYALLLVPQAGRILAGTAGEVTSHVLFALTLFAALPLALLLLVAMPAGLAWAAFRGPPGGTFGRMIRVGCVASMAFAVLYSAVLTAGWVDGLTQAEVWWRGLLHVAVLLCGLAATWRAWRWLGRHPGSGQG